MMIQGFSSVKGVINQSTMTHWSISCAIAQNVSPHAIRQNSSMHLVSSRIWRYQVVLFHSLHHHVQSLTFMWWNKKHILMRCTHIFAWKLLYNGLMYFYSLHQSISCRHPILVKYSIISNDDSGFRQIQQKTHNWPNLLEPCLALITKYCWEEQSQNTSELIPKRVLPVYIECQYSTSILQIFWTDIQ